MSAVEIPPKIRPLQRITSTWLNSIIDALAKLKETLTSGTEEIYVRNLIAELVRSRTAVVDDGYFRNLLANYVGGDGGWFRDLFAEYLQAEYIKADEGQFTNLRSDTFLADNIGGRKGVFTNSVQTSFVDSRAGSFSDYLLVAGVPVSPGVAAAGPATYVAVSDQVVTSSEIGVVPTGVEHNVKTLTVKGALHVKGSLQAFGSVDIQGEAVMKGDISIHTLPPYAPLPSDINRSGIDPNSPPWAPPGGWSQVVEFTSSADLDFFTYISGDVVVEDHALRVKFKPGYWSYAERCEEDMPSWQRVASCFLPVNRLSYDDWAVAYFDAFYEEEAPVSIDGIVLQKKSDGNVIKLVDYNTVEEVPFEYNGDWVVVVLDFPSKTLSAYNRLGQKLASIQLTTYTGSIKRRCIDLYVGSRTSEATVFYVDWIAVK